MAYQVQLLVEKTREPSRLAQDLANLLQGLRHDQIISISHSVIGEGLFAQYAVLVVLDV